MIAQGRRNARPPTPVCPRRTHFGRAILTFFDRLAAGCLRKQPTGGEENRRLSIFSAHTTACACASSGLRKGPGRGSESTVNCALLFSFAVTSRHFRDVRINQRIDSLPCPALFSMFPGRQAASPRDEPPSAADADSPNYNDRPAQARTTFGLCGRKWWAGRRRSGKWMNAGGMEVAKGL